MIAYFKERNSFQVPALLFVTLALKLVFIYHPNTETLSQPGGLLSEWLSNDILPGLNPTFVTVVSLLILFLSALFANYLLVSCRMTGRNNLLVALSIILFTSLFPTTNQMSAATLLLPLIIVLFRQITRLYNNAKVRPVIINIGMLTGAGYLLYHPFIWLLPCCFIGLAGMRAFRITEWLLLLLGFITPAYFLLSYEFLSNQWAPKAHLIDWQVYHKFPFTNPYWWAAIAVLAIWILAAVPIWQQQMRRMLIQSRKNWYQLIFMGIFILPMAIFPVGNASEALTLFSFPAASFAANAFTGERTTLSVLFIWLIIAMIGVASWIHFR
ncbi:MAG: hypothetical protein V4717_04670 [Bacteroidota bacterium]